MDELNDAVQLELGTWHNDGLETCIMRATAATLATKKKRASSDRLEFFMIVSARSR